jgi:hypothetical protein
VLNIGVAQGQACTIVLRGATQQILDEAERSIHDALCVLSQTVKEPRICYGGGLFIYFYFIFKKKRFELINRCCGNVNGYCCFSIS